MKPRWLLFLGTHLFAGAVGAMLIWSFHTTGPQLVHAQNPIHQELEAKIIDNPLKIVYTETLFAKRTATDNLFVRNVDMVKLNESLLTALIRKHVISQEEASAMMDEASSGPRPMAVFLTEEGKKARDAAGQNKGGR